MTKFWYRDGQFTRVPSREEHLEWARDHLEDRVKGRDDWGVIGFPQLFADGWVRIEVFPDKITIHSTTLKDHSKMIGMTKEVYNYLEQTPPKDKPFFRDGAVVEVDVDDWSSSPYATEKRFQLSTILDVPNSRDNDNNWWEAGPADEWISKIHKGIGVAKLRERREIRAAQMGNQGAFWWRDGRTFQSKANHIVTAKYLWPDEMTGWHHQKSGLQDYRIPFGFGAIRGGVDGTYCSMWIHGPGLNSGSYMLKRVVQDIYDWSGGTLNPNSSVMIDSSDTHMNTESKVGSILNLQQENKAGKEEFWETSAADAWISRIHKDIGVAKLRKRREIRAKLLKCLIKHH